MLISRELSTSTGLSRSIVAQAAKRWYIALELGFRTRRRSCPISCMGFSRVAFSKFRRKNRHNARFYLWEAQHHQAREPLLRLLPHFRLKRRHAELALALMDLVEQQNAGAEQDAERRRLYACTRRWRFSMQDVDAESIACRPDDTSRPDP
jgi:hypothetical protein